MYCMYELAQSGTIVNDPLHYMHSVCIKWECYDACIFVIKNIATCVENC